jgi:hypothetical protein
MFHKLIKYRHGDTPLSMTTKPDIDSYSQSGSSYDSSNIKELTISCIHALVVAGTCTGDAISTLDH